MLSKKFEVRIYTDVDCVKSTFVLVHSFNFTSIQSRNVFTLILTLNFIADQ